MLLCFNTTHNLLLAYPRWGRVYKYTVEIVIGHSPNFILRIWEYVKGTPGHGCPSEFMGKDNAKASGSLPTDNFALPHPNAGDPKWEEKYSYVIGNPM